MKFSKLFGASLERHESQGIWKREHHRCAMARGGSGEVSEAAVHLESLLDK